MINTFRMIKRVFWIFTYMHDEIEGLFPCGEGAGYAGGIVSAAMDGQNVAKAVKRFLEK